MSQPNQMWIVNLTTHGWAVNNVGVCLGTGPACDIVANKRNWSSDSYFGERQNREAAYLADKYLKKLKRQLFLG